MQSCVFSISAIPGGHLSARHFVAEAGYFSLLVQRKVTKRKDTPSLVRYADALTLQSVRGFADGTSMYRGKRSSSMTRPLLGLSLTALQGSAATQG